LVILACNTASAEALRKLQREYLPMNQPEKRILGVIIPTAEELVEDNLVTRVGIIATEGTVNSKAYIRELHKLNPALHVHQMPAPLLVPLIESGRLSGKEVEACLDTYLAPLLKNKIEALILGCTHFGIIESEIMNAIGDSVRIYNQPKIVADKLAHYLNRHDTLRSKLSRGRTITYLTTGDPVQFVKLAKVISGTRKGFIEIKKVDILS
jgi:glutamate racemase